LQNTVENKGDILSRSLWTISGHPAYLRTSKAHRFVAAHLEDPGGIDTDDHPLDWCWENYISFVFSDLH